MDNRKPFVGEIVHYHPDADDMTCRLKGISVCAAMVLAIHEPNNVNLKIFTDGEPIVRKTSVLRQVDTEQNSWSYSDEVDVAPAATTEPAEPAEPAVDAVVAPIADELTAPASVEAVAAATPEISIESVPTETVAEAPVVEEKADEAPASVEAVAAPHSVEKSVLSDEGTADTSDEVAGDQPSVETVSSNDASPEQVFPDPEALDNPGPSASQPESPLPSE